MKIMIPYFMKILFWFSFVWFFMCGSLPPKEGVITQITGVDGSVNKLMSGDQFFNIQLSIANPQTVIQTLAEAQNYSTNHGGIRLGGNWILFHQGYGCYNFIGPFSAHYVLIFKRDNVNANHLILYDFVNRPILTQNQSISAQFTFNVTFDDPNITMPESHVYTLEFWECMGECKPDEYDKKTDKKAEIVIYYSVVP